MSRRRSILEEAKLRNDWGKESGLLWCWPARIGVCSILGLGTYRMKAWKSVTGFWLDPARWRLLGVRIGQLWQCMQCIHKAALWASLTLHGGQNQCRNVGNQMLSVLVFTLCAEAGLYHPGWATCEVHTGDGAVPIILLHPWCLHPAASWMNSAPPQVSLPSWPDGSLEPCTLGQDVHGVYKSLSFNLLCTHPEL